MHIPFDNTYANLPTHFYQKQAAEPVSNPALIAWNSTLASELGIVAQDDGDIAGVFSGNQDANGSAPLRCMYRMDGRATREPRDDEWLQATGFCVPPTH